MRGIRGCGGGRWWIWRWDGRAETCSATTLKERSGQLGVAGGGLVDLGDDDGNNDNDDDDQKDD